MLLRKFSFIFGIIMMIGLVNALVINSPENNTYLQNGYFNVTSELASSNVSFYLNNETSFGSENEICFFEDTADNEELVCTSVIAENNILSIGSIDFYMKFDNHTGNLYDSSGNGMVMTLALGTPSYNKYNGATLGHYNSSDGSAYIFSDLTPTFTIDDIDDFSMGLWVYDDTCHEVGANTIAMQGLASNGYMAFGISGSTSRGYGSVYLSMDDAQSSGGESIPCREWTFISATYDGTTHEGRNYINGRMVKNRTIWDGNGIVQTTQWKVGMWEATNWNGSIDEVWTDKGEIWSDEDMLKAYKFGEGEYYFKANEIDGGSSAETSMLTWFLDLYNPIINIVSPFYEHKDGTMIIKITDPNSFANVSLNVTLDGVQIDYVDFNDSITYINNTELAKGDYNLTILATDLSGRTITKEELFTVITSVAIKINNDSGIGILRFFSPTGYVILRFFGQ